MVKLSRIKYLLEPLVVSSLTFSFFSFLYFRSPFLPEPDCFFHIKFAFLTRVQGFLQNFEWAQLSLWRDQFTDKEILFHIFLIPFTYFEDLYFGAKLAGIFLVTLLGLSFFLVLKLNRIRFAFLWSLTLFTVSWPFTLRMVTPRPHILSLILILWFIHFYLNKKWKSITFISFIYAWSYTGIILPLVFTLLGVAPSLLLRGKADWTPVLYTLIGLFLGMLINPYFPQNFISFYLTNFYILWAEIKGLDLSLGGELLSISTRAMVKYNSFVFALHVLFAYRALILPTQPKRQLEILFLISLGTLFLTFMSKRFIEYSVPMSLLYFAFYTDYALDGLRLRKIFSLYPMRAWGFTLLGTVFLLGLFHINYKEIIPNLDFNESDLKKSAQYIKKNIPAKETLFTCSWDYTSELFFFDHIHRYFVFLDPSYMYFWNKDIWEKWSKVSKGLYNDQTAKMMKDTFKVQYGVCTKDNINLYTIVKTDSKMKILYEDPRVYVFKIL